MPQVAWRENLKVLQKISEGSVLMMRFALVVPWYCGELEEFQDFFDATFACDDDQF